MKSGSHFREGKGGVPWEKKKKKQKAKGIGIDKN